MPDGFVVTEQIDHARPDMDYPLLPGDLLIKHEGEWWKECPGVAIGGFILTEEQEASLVATEYQARGLDYFYNGGPK